jgi:hypothetical protein
VTDGLLEALNQDNEEFGCERLIAVVVDQRETGAYSLRRGILNEVSRFCDGVFQDDVSMIVVTAERCPAPCKRPELVENLLTNANQLTIDGIGQASALGLSRWTYFGLLLERPAN